MTYSQDRVFSLEGNAWVNTASALSVSPSFRSCVVIGLATQAIPIIADEAVEKDFGTGILKITPAHDRLDFEIAQRHDLPMIDILNPDGTLNELAGGDFVGMDRFSARKSVVKKLSEDGHLLDELLDALQLWQGVVGQPLPALVGIEEVDADGLEARRRGDLRDAVAHEAQADDADRRDLLYIRVALGLVGLFLFSDEALLLRRACVAKQVGGPPRRWRNVDAASNACRRASSRCRGRARQGARGAAGFLPGACFCALYLRAAMPLSAWRRRVLLKK